MKALHFSLLPVLFALSIMGSASFAHAASDSAPVCFTFEHGIRYGQQDKGGNVDVDNLQNFLVNKGYLKAAELGTGHFGKGTLRALKKFQKANGLEASGYVGPLTRAAIAKAQPDCGKVAAARLYSISPGSGPTGTTVSIRGFGFSGSNTVLIDGLVAGRGIPISSSVAIACTTDPSCHGGINQTIIFTIPQTLSPDCPVGSMCPMYVRLLEAGDVTITVRNNNAVSNGLPFTVTK